MLRRAHALLDIKSIDDEQRILEGFTSTPTPDRSGDSLDPKGASFNLPLPLLWQHRTDQPIGKVLSAKVDGDGIWVKAQIDKTTGLPFIEEAWALIKAGLVGGLSVGWKPLELPTISKDGRVATFSKWLWAETSAVTVPANSEASIALIKSLDTSAPATGLDPSRAGVTAFPVRYKKLAQTQPSYHEQITDLANRRAAHEARLGAIQQQATGEGRTKDDSEREEFDTLKGEIGQMDRELKDLRDLEDMNRSKAVPIVAATPDLATGSRAPSTIRVRPMTPPGTAFIRMCMALAWGKGDSFKAMERAKSYHDMPEVELMTKAAVAAGTTTDATWAGPLVQVQPLVDEFLELLRPRTLLGRIPGMRRVPFNVSIASQTTGGTYGWVGQQLAKPVTKADYATVTHGFAKAAGIIVISEELAKLSTPSAEALVREEMIAGMGQFLDLQFQDPAVAAVANVNPASITNGAPTAAASGATSAAAKADLAGRVAVFTAANIPLDGAVWLMNDSNAFGIAMSVNSLGQPLFPGFNGISGGSLFGMPVVVSNSLSTRVVLMHAPSILYSDDGGVSIDVSREASVQMDSVPATTTDATTVLVSLWQRNLIGLKAERFINWTRARTNSVTYLTAAAYTGA